MNAIWTESSILKAHISIGLRKITEAEASNDEPQETNLLENINIRWKCKEGFLHTKSLNDGRSRGFPLK